MVHIAVAVVEGYADHLAMALAAHIRQQVAHGKAAVAKAPQPCHLPPEVGGMHDKAAIRRPFDCGLAYLVIHKNRNHVADYIGATIIYFACSKIAIRSEEHTSELQSLMRISYAVFCLNKKIKKNRI